MPTKRSIKYGTESDQPEKKLGRGQNKRFFYQATGGDSSSDDNYFVIILRAKNLTHATLLARKHIAEEKGRDDLAIEKIERIKSDGVLFSSVEPKR